MVICRQSRPDVAGVILGLLGPRIPANVARDYPTLNTYCVEVTRPCAAASTIVYHGGDRLHRENGPAQRRYFRRIGHNLWSQSKMNPHTEPGTIAKLPTDPAPTDGGVYIQVALDPTTARKDWPDAQLYPASCPWEVLPHHLVFGVHEPDIQSTTTPSAPPTAMPGMKNMIKTPSSSPSRRLPAAMSVVTNMIGCNSAATQIETSKMRCVGVTTDLLPYSQSESRFSIAIAGVVTVACNRGDLCDAAVGDTVYYTFEESEIYFEGAENHRSVKLCTEQSIHANIETHFKNNKSDPYKLPVDEWQLMNQVLGTLVAYSRHHDECRILLRL